MDKLTTKHLIFIIWGTTIVSIKTNVNVFIRSGGRDTWICVAVSSFLILLFLIYILKIFKRNNTFSFTKIYKVALGNFLGTILLMFMIFTLILTLIECSAVEANAMHTNIFIETPTWYLAAFFVIPAIYTVKKGITPIITVTIIGMLLAMLAGINLVILTSSYKNYNYLRPILANGITLDILFTIVRLLGFYGSLIILFPYISYVKDKTKLIRHSIIGLLVVIQMLIISFTGAIATFGAGRVTDIAYPKLLQTQEINYFGFLESGELFVMFQIIGGWFVKYILTFFITLKLINDLNLKNKYIAYPITIIVFLCGYWASSNLFRLTSLLNYYAYISLVNFIIIPLIVFTIFNIKNKNKVNTNKP
jgi:spore germination protein (amino acid permease)